MKDEIPTTITVDSVGYTGTVMPSQQARESVSEGRRDQYRFSAYLILTDLAAEPDTDDLVTIAGIEYQILGKMTDEVDSIIRLDLAERYTSGI